MELVYGIICVIIGVAVTLFIGVDSISGMFAKKEKEFDDKNE